jgi:hypothetical protein
MNKKKKNESDKTNVFLKALEKTTDSQTKNLTTMQVPVADESESTNDELRAIKKIRSNIFKGKKLSKNKSINFEDVLNSDNGSGTNSTIQNKSSKSKSSKLKDNSINEDTANYIDSNSTTKKLDTSKNQNLSQNSMTLRNKKILNKQVIAEKSQKATTDVTSETINNNTDLAIKSNKSNISHRGLNKSRSSSIPSNVERTRTKSNLMEERNVSDNDNISLQVKLY